MTNIFVAKSPEFPKIELSNICRFCLSYGLQKDIFKIQFKETSLAQMIKDLCNLEIEIKDGLPQNICENCLAFVARIHSFKEMCLQSDYRLKRLVASKNGQEINTENIAFENRTSSFDDFQKFQPGKGVKPKLPAVTKQKLHECLCGKSFAQTFTYEKHKRMCPNHNVQFSCPFCKLIFMDKNSLQLHEHVHKELYSTSEQLAEPIKPVQIELDSQKVIFNDLPDKQFKCKFCDRRFATEFTCACHEKSHNKGAIKKNGIIKPYPELKHEVASLKKPENSSIRLKTCKKNANIKDNKPRTIFACSVCGRAYVHQGILAIHMMYSHK